LQNRFVPFQFAVTFYKIFGFPVEATLTRSLIKHIRFEDVSNRRISEACSHFLYNKANKHQSAIYAPLYERTFKHSNRRIHVILESKDYKNIPAQEEIRSKAVIRKLVFLRR